MSSGGYVKSNSEEALSQIVDLMQAVKKVNGTFVSVWHNESLSDQGIWKGWRNVYEKMLIEAPYATGDVVSVRLSSGEEIVGKLLDDNEKDKIGKFGNLS